jgi:uncharacterized membrane protein
MSTRTRLLSSGFITILFLAVISGRAMAAAGNVILYTPCTKISVPPGESIDYNIDVINNGADLFTADVSATSMPRGWNFMIKSGGWNVGQISVLAGEKKSLSLHVEVPYQVNKGNYRFSINAGEYSLPLVINVSEQGTFKTDFSSRQSNMEGHSGSTFTYNAELKNQTTEKQLYALSAQIQRGWNVSFKVSGRDVTSVESEPMATTNLTIDINPPSQIEAGRYTIPVVATTSTSTTTLNLEVVITGTYNIELTTPTGLLSGSITAGQEKKMEFLVRNSGTSFISDVRISGSAPAGWSVSFDPKTIDKIMPGAEAQVIATVKADKHAIPGDYIANFDARTPEASAKAAFRFSVKTPMLWGWVGIFIIFAAIGSVYYLFRKYGRR